MQSVFDISPTKTWLPNPADPSRRLYFAYDFVHNIKNARNHLLDDIVKLPCGSTASKKDLIDLIDKCSHSEIASSTHTSLNDFVISVRSGDRQNVSTALKIFSPDVANLLRKLYPTVLQKQNLADYLETMSNAFKIMTSTQIDASEQMKSALGTWYEGQIEILERALYYFQMMSYKSPTQKTFTHKRFQTGAIITIKSVISVHQVMKNEYGVPYLCTTTVSQDFLERKFGLYRSLNGSCTNPPAQTFLQIAGQDLKSILLAVK